MNRYEVEIVKEWGEDVLGVTPHPTGDWTKYTEVFNIEGKGVVYPNEVEQKFKDLVMAFSPTLHKQLPFYKLDRAFYDVAEKTGWVGVALKL